MDLKVTTLDGKAAGSVTLNKDIFGLEPRTDLIQRCIVWQLAKRRAGTPMPMTSPFPHCSKECSLRWSSMRPKGSCWIFRR